MFDYVKGLIKMRKDHPAFRMPTANLIATSLQFEEGYAEGIFAFKINGKTSGDKWKMIFVLFNGTGEEKEIVVQPGQYEVAVAGNMFSDVIGGKEGYWRLEPYTCTIFYEK